MKIAVLGTLIVGLLSLSLGAEEAYAGTSSMMVPLSSTVVVPLADSTDAVTLNGELHVVVGTSPSKSGDLRIHANLAHVTGVGSSSGAAYSAVGSTSIVLHNLESTIAPRSFTFLGFKLIEYPPSPCLDSSSCNSGNTASLFPLEVTFSVQETELGYWSATISCVAYPPSPCLDSSGQ